MLVVVSRKGHLVQVPPLRGNVMSHSPSMTDDLPADWSPIKMILGSVGKVVSMLKADSFWMT